MNNLHENNSWRIVGLKHSTDEIKWYDYTESIDGSARKFDSLCRARQFLSLKSILHYYKSIVCPCIEYGLVLQLYIRIYFRICEAIIKGSVFGLISTLLKLFFVSVDVAFHGRVRDLFFFK